MGVEMELTERRAKFVYDAARLAAQAALAPIVPVIWDEREQPFKDQFCKVIERQCGDMRSRSPAFLHCSWMQAYIDMGWKHGEKYDRENKIHPDLVPYADDPNKKPKKGTGDFVEILAIIDRSGSMAKIKGDAIGGFNEFLEQQKALPGKANFTLALFSGDYDLVYSGVDLQEVPKMSDHNYRPRGWTALLDAIGRAVTDVNERLASLPDEQRPGKVIVAILIDGEENSSKKYKREEIRVMIDAQREAGWEFIFLAANQDAFAEGKSLGILLKDTHAFLSTGQGVHTSYERMSGLVSSYRGGSSNSGGNAHD